MLISFQVQAIQLDSLAMSRNTQTTSHAQVGHSHNVSYVTGSRCIGTNFARECPYGSAGRRAGRRAGHCSIECPARSSGGYMV